MMFKHLVMTSTFVILISGCSATGGSTPVNNAIHDSVMEQVELTSFNDITITGGKQENGLFKEISIAAPAAIKTFTWSNVTNPAYYPAIEVADLNEDGDNEIILVLTKAYGIGVNAQEIHVLRENTLTELTVEDPMTYISKHSHTSIQKSGGKVDVTVDIDGETYKKDYEASYAGTWNDKVWFGSVLNYEVSDNKLVAFVPGNISSAEYPVTIKLEYGKDLKVAKATIIEP